MMNLAMAPSPLSLPSCCLPYRLRRTSPSAAAHALAAFLLLGHPPRADHPDMLVHQLLGGGAIAPFDQPRQLPMRIEDLARDLGCQGRIAGRPGDVLEGE